MRCFLYAGKGIAQQCSISSHNLHASNDDVRPHHSEMIISDILVYRDTAGFGILAGEICH
jgi:hypothetical protein